MQNKPNKFSWKNIFSSIVEFFGNTNSNREQEPAKEEVNSFVLAGGTSLGMLYVDIDKACILKKAGNYYLAVYAKEEYTDLIFLRTLRKDKDLKNVVAAVYLYLFNNTGSSYCIVGNCLVDEQGNVCLDNGKDMRMKKLTADDTTMLNAYTLCLKALEIENNKMCDKE